MKITFHGAAREVTGSCHLVECRGRRVLLDCGMIQGGRERHERNREPFPFDPASLDRVILSHAHIDHSGRLPLLVKRGYQGPILATEATAELCRILLADSGRIHEEDARWKIKRLKRQNKDWKWVTPLFTEEDADAVNERFETVPFDEPHEVDGAATVRFVKAGHILGAAIVDLELESEGKRCRLAFSGDLGVDGARLLSSPKSLECPDYLLIESTYGDRRREEAGDRTDLLYEVIRRTAERGGRVIIPSFAVGRTQEILARLNDLAGQGKLSGVPVFVDSPMAIAATKVFATHPDAWSDTARRKLHCGDKPLDFEGLRFTPSVEESMELNRMRGPAVIISASGMCTAGRVKHHLKHDITDHRNTVLFVGYQAHGTLGRVIQQGTNPVRIFGDWYQVRAEIATIEGFSAHADLDELLHWYGSLNGTPRRTFTVHGDEDACLAFAGTLRSKFGGDVEVPGLNQTFDLD